MGQKCEWCRLEMGSGWHLIRYFYEKKQIIILQLLQPTGPVLFSGHDRLPRIKSGAWNFIQETWTPCYNTLPVAQLWPPDTRLTGDHY